VKETQTTPYLIRAIFEWCCDNGFTPYVAVKVDDNTRVPAEYVKNGEIVLNLSPDATRNLKIGNELIQFSARFAGVSRELSVPISAVTGIFAKETGQGLAFQVASSTRGMAGLVKGPPQGDQPDGNHPRPSGRKPRLHVIK
jgi:stringent starvation protein B